MGAACPQSTLGRKAPAGTLGPGAGPTRELVLAFGGTRRRQAPSRRGSCSVWDQGISIPFSLPLAPLAQVPPAPPRTALPGHQIWCGSNPLKSLLCEWVPAASSSCTTEEPERFLFWASAGRVGDKTGGCVDNPSLKPSPFVFTPCSGHTSERGLAPVAQHSPQLHVPAPCSSLAAVVATPRDSLV